MHPERPASEQLILFRFLCEGSGAENGSLVTGVNNRYAELNYSQACVVRKDNLKFSHLSADEIETQLTLLAERDDAIAGQD